MITNYNQAFPGDAHGLGFELNQRWYMGGLSGPRTAGHTGYTGTSIVIDFDSRSFAILLTNRVHPSRNWGSNNPARRVARRDWRWPSGSPRATAPTAWFSGTRDATTATLTTPPLDVRRGASLSFDLFVDTESSDPLTLESSRDGGVDVDRAALQAARPGPPDHGVGRGHRGERQPSLAAGDRACSTPVRCRSAGATPRMPSTPGAASSSTGSGWCSAEGTRCSTASDTPGDLIPQGWSPVRR